MLFGLQKPIQQFLNTPIHFGRTAPKRPAQANLVNHVFEDLCNATSAKDSTYFQAQHRSIAVPANGDYRAAYLQLRQQEADAPYPFQRQALQIQGRNNPFTLNGLL